MWRPTPARPFATFATLGMSDRPMTVPPDAVRSGAARYAELVVSLPADWPVPDGGSWADEAAFMPVRALKTQLLPILHRRGVSELLDIGRRSTVG